MSKIKYKDCIIESIADLRKRKARPDVERICHMAKRKQGISFEDTQADLQRLVEEGVVGKVDYKRGVSYRIEGKWTKGDKGKRTTVTDDDKECLLNVVRELSHRNPVNTDANSTPKSEIGVNFTDIEKHFAEDGRETLNIRTLLKEHIKAGKLVCHSDGTITCAAMQNEKKMSKSGNVTNVTVSRKSASPSPTLSTDVTSEMPASAKNNTPKRGRPVTKRKKIHRRSQPTESPTEDSAGSKCAKRESSEPSEETEPVATTSEAVELNTEISTETEGAMDEEPRCDFCLQTAAANKLDEPEELLACKDCKAKAHPTCMGYSDDLARRAKRSPWQCIDCKTCYICEDSGDADAMLFCDACDKGYHMNCHKPPVCTKPTGNWMCHECVLELGLPEDDEMTGDPPNSSAQLPSEQNSDAYNTDGGGPSCLPTPSASPVPPHEEPMRQERAPSATCSKDSPRLPKLSLTLPIVVPDASDWSIDDVADFFCKVGFPDQAETFREQEIDGKSLLLLKRNDVLTGLSLRLGPALKIYAHVQHLQTGGKPVH